MEIRTRKITNTVAEYVAEDGRVFSNKKDCEYYEWKSKATPVWAVTARGQRSDEAELYSTKGLAKKAVGDSAVHTITKVYLDQRFWDIHKDGVDIQEARKYFYTKEGYMGNDIECIALYKKAHHD